MADFKDQWKAGGMCELCRRREYCKKECTKHKELRAIAAREAVNKVLREKFPGVKESMEDYGYDS
jgi:hypothetical protein